MQAKSKAYIDALYRDTPKSPKTGGIMAFNIYIGIIGLAAWPLFWGGPALALQAAHTLTWIAIILGTIGLCAVSWITFYIQAKIRKLSDRLADGILFASKRPSNKILKFIARLPAFVVFILAIIADWPVAAVYLGSLIAASFILQSINRFQQNTRIEEIEATEAYALDNSLVDEETFRKQIDDVFRKK